MRGVDGAGGGDDVFAAWRPWRLLRLRRDLAAPVKGTTGARSGIGSVKMI
jgi:hypothetical protein